MHPRRTDEAIERVSKEVAWERASVESG